MSTDSGAQVRLERWTVTSGSNANSRAAVVLRAGGRDWQASADGNGPVDALCRAVDAALASLLGGRPVLLSFDIHALAEGPDAEGRVTVAIAPPPTAAGERAEGRHDGEATSVNIVAASVEAYVAALNALLSDPAWAGAAAAAAQREGTGELGAADHGTAGTQLDTNADPIDTMDWFNR